MTWRHVAMVLGLAVVAIFGGAAILAVSEHLSYPIALYWAVETATTVGYGDITPHTTAGHIAAVVVMLVSIPSVGAVFAMSTALHLRGHVDRRLAEHHHRLRKDLGLEDHDG